MKIKVKLVNGAALKANNEKLKEAASDGAHRGLLKLGFLIVGNGKKRIISGGKSGRIYKSGKKGSHQASAPGESPANWTGRLLNAIMSEASGAKAVIVAAQTVYASWLEFGTRKMAARPFLKPAIDEEAPKGSKLMQEEINKGFKKL